MASVESLAARAGDTTENNPWPLALYSQKFAQHVSNAPSAWIEAQIVSLKRYPKGAYLKLKDVDQEAFLPASTFVDGILAKIDSVSEGSKVILRITPQFWTKRGEVSMSILDLKEVGVGDLLKQIEELKIRLFEEGLFANENKKPLPFLPRKIGLICGRNAQAKDDVVENVHRRWPSFGGNNFQKFSIFEVSVGNSPSTPSEVISALNSLENSEDVDVIVIARGGGALEEVVIPFSDESLLRAVYGCKIPVVSAIGHETDTPLLNFVADFAASTPTDAAKRIVPNFEDEIQIISQLNQSASNSLSKKVEFEKQFVSRFSKASVLVNPQNLLKPHFEKIEQLTLRLNHSFSTKLQNEMSTLKQQIEKINSFDPHFPLRRGYAIVQNVNGDAIQTGKSLKTGDEVQIMFNDITKGAQIK